jgi:hypothetical protein
MGHKGICSYGPVGVCFGFFVWEKLDETRYERFDQKRCMGILI